MANVDNPESLTQRLRKIAEELGIPEHTIRWRHYHGYPLDKKYTPQKNPSAKHAANTAARKAAKERGDMKYEGPPCVRCGNPLRYVANTNCVLCANGRV